jgi:hypothetical protein
MKGAQIKWAFTLSVRHKSKSIGTAYGILFFFLVIQGYELMKRECSNGKTGSRNGVALEWAEWTLNRRREKTEFS